MAYEHECSLENARLFADWIANRGGVAVWRSVNLSNPGASWSTPALTVEGEPTPKPTWQAANTPEKIVTRSREDWCYHLAGSEAIPRWGTDGITGDVRQSHGRRYTPDL